jgi:uncharacterized membrane protein
MTGSGRWRTITPIGLWVLGIALLAIGIARGEGSFGLVLCIPFLMGSGPLFALGILAILAGTFAFVLLRFNGGRYVIPDARGEDRDPRGRYSSRPGSARTHSGTGSGGRDRTTAPRDDHGFRGVIFLGPFPIPLGGGKLERWMIVVGVLIGVLMVGSVLLSLLWLR